MVQVPVKSASLRDSIVWMADLSNPLWVSRLDAESMTSFARNLELQQKEPVQRTGSTKRPDT